MSKGRYKLDNGPWVDFDQPLPFTIPSTAAQTVTVEPVGQPVVKDGTVSGYILTLAYDPSNPTTSVQASTNIGGIVRWALTTSMTPPSYAAITAGTGFYAAGTVNTVAGTRGIDLPAMSGADDLFFHAFVDGNPNDTNIASTRVYIGTNSVFATIGSTTGNPVVNDYVDGDGVSWRSFEWRQNGSFTVTAAGGVEHEHIGGGGGGGGGGGYQMGGGGGAGGYLSGSSTLNPGTYDVTVGIGGTGRTSTAQATNGGDTTALGSTAIGGGAGGTNTGGGNDENTGKTGGSGGGAGGGISLPAPGTDGQGFAGGAGIAAGAAGAGGGGAAGPGASATADADNRVGGKGGAGITSNITGTAQGVAGGGGGSATTFTTGTYTGGAASHGGGKGGAGVGNGGAPGADATTPGSGGGGSYGTAPGGKGAPGRFVIRVKR